MDSLDIVTFFPVGLALLCYSIAWFLYVRYKRTAISWPLYISLALIVCGIASAAAGLAIRINTLSDAEVSPELSDRISSVSENLESTAQDLVEIQSDLEEQIAYVEQLNQDAKTAEAVMDLTQEQRDAISTLLGERLDQNATQERWESIAVNTGFFLLGFTPIIIAEIKKRKQNQKEQNHESN